MVAGKLAPSASAAELDLELNPAAADPSLSPSVSKDLDGKAEAKDRGCCAGAKIKGAKLKNDLRVGYVCVPDADTRWGAKILVSFVCCISLSPLDWVPECRSFNEATADHLLMPFLIGKVMKLVPPQVIEKARCVVADGFQFTMRRDWKLIIGVCVFVVLNLSAVAQILCLIGSGVGWWQESWTCNHQNHLLGIIAIIVSCCLAVFISWRLIVEFHQEKLQSKVDAMKQLEAAAGPELNAGTDAVVRIKLGNGNSNLRMNERLLDCDAQMSSELSGDLSGVASSPPPPSLPVSSSAWNQGSLPAYQADRV